MIKEWIVLNNEQKFLTYPLGSSCRSKATVMKTSGTTLFST